ncbi:MAG: hypothetical protein K9K79_11280 [Desulfohalobiaceae bacterium]|nr:hypothetical protein [Desulfohalobiaceae bacterium]
MSKRLKNLDIAYSKDMTLSHAHKSLARHLDTVKQLQKVNDNANELLDQLMKWNRGDPEALRILESQVRYVKHGDEEEPVREFKFKDPRELALKVMAEIRGQLKLQHEILQSLYNIKSVKEFQEEIIRMIGEAEPEARERLVNRLTRLHPVNSTIGFSQEGDQQNFNQ